MTETPAYPGYATPTFTYRDDLSWFVRAEPWDQFVGTAHDKGPVGWAAFNPLSHRVGLFPEKQAAGEALVKHAGYEVLR